MPKKRKDGIIDTTLDVVTAGAAIGVGGLTLGAIGSQGGPQVQRLTATGQSGLGIISGGLPIMAAGGLLKEVKKLGKK